MAKAVTRTAVSLSEEDRVSVGRLLSDVGESEHQLRHKAAFAKLCGVLSFEIAHDGSRVTVTDLLAPPAEESAEAPAPQRA